MCLFILQGSWKLGLRNGLKKFRKGYPKKKRASENHSDKEPPSKRARLYLEDDGQIDEDVYIEAVEKLQYYGKNKKSGKHGEIKQLMELTKLKRHQWIRTERPLIFDVVRKFPCLATTKWVSRINYILWLLTCLTIIIFSDTARV